jgi:hypothetical protein
MWRDSLTGSNYEIERIDTDKGLYCKTVKDSGVATYFQKIEPNLVKVGCVKAFRPKIVCSCESYFWRGACKHISHLEGVLTENDFKRPEQNNKG